MSIQKEEITLKVKTSKKHFRIVLKACPNGVHSRVLIARLGTCPRAVFLKSACPCLRHEHVGTRALTSNTAPTLLILNKPLVTARLVDSLT